MRPPPNRKLKEKQRRKARLTARQQGPSETELQALGASLRRSVILDKAEEMFGWVEGDAYTDAQIEAATAAIDDDYRREREAERARDAIAKRGRRFNDAPIAGAAGGYEPTDDVLAKVRELAPGWDRQALLARYREWIAEKTPAEKTPGAFLAWAKNVTKDRPPS